MTSSLVDTAVTVAPISLYTGPWTWQQAGHLLRRATFAPLKSEIDEAVALGLNNTLSTLFAAAPLPAPPVYYDYADHPDAGIGDSWVDLHTNPIGSTGDNNARRRSLEAWWMLTYAESGLNIREKMCFFWHNHFGMSGNASPKPIYQFLTKYRELATGDFRQLVKDMTVNPYMLKFLNGETNTAANPNENFAREILELFTLGKGPQIGSDDYTNYTEHDIVELAKAFTGWRTRNFNTQMPGQVVESYFTNNRHDTSVKTLSHRFNFAEIQNAGAEEYKNVVDLIFQQEEVSRFICRKLYRYFVYYKIDAAVEAQIIEPMAQTLRDNNYVIAPALQQLLGSQHFYDISLAGDMIKTPLDIVHGVFRPTGYYQQATLPDTYFAARTAYLQARNMDLDLRFPPSVSGWTAYYQEPGYYRLWLNTATLQTRTDFHNRCLSRNGFFWSGSRHPFDWLAYIANFPDAVDPNALIENLTRELLPQPLLPEQIAALKELLLPGLQDFVWSGEYANFLANPNDSSLRASVESRLKEMLTGLYQLAEYQVL